MRIKEKKDHRVCPYCGAKMSPSETLCPTCGADVTGPTPHFSHKTSQFRRAGKKTAAAGFILIALGLGAIVVQPLLGLSFLILGFIIFFVGYNM